jgi:hypothetical protein
MQHDAGVQAKPEVESRRGNSGRSTVMKGSDRRVWPGMARRCHSGEAENVMPGEAGQV